MTITAKTVYTTTDGTDHQTREAAIAAQGRIDRIARLSKTDFNHAALINAQSRDDRDNDVVYVEHLQDAVLGFIVDNGDKILEALALPGRPGRKPRTQKPTGEKVIA